MTTLPAPAPINVVTRRQLLGGAGVLLLTAGCSREETAATAAAPGDFPVTIDHKHGSTTIPAPPTRVVSVGLSDHDTLLALGITPVGVAEWYGDYPFATWPWARDELGGAQPEIVGDSTALEFEKIAALRPDVITGVYSALTADQYDTLSKIAPTVAQSGQHPDWGTPWQQMARVIGRAVGREGRAEELVAGVQSRFAAVRRQHPEFDGAAAVFVLPMPDGAFHAYTSADTRGQFLTSFGFTVPPRIAELADGNFYADVSAERLGIVDGVGVLVWDAANVPPARIAEIRNSELYQQFGVVREGRDVFIADEVVLGAIAWSTVLSLPFAIDHLVPRLAAAIDGDPATRATSGS